ncbi:MAG: DUF2200 family protein [Flavobacteriaceae bacterium]|nr:DUF2200 family protein [Flavobacteriaceae bacterium]
MKNSFKNAKFNYNTHLITCVICGHRIEKINTALTKKLAIGRKIEKTLRRP